METINESIILEDCIDLLVEENKNLNDFDSDNEELTEAYKEMRKARSNIESRIADIRNIILIGMITIDIRKLRHNNISCSLSEPFEHYDASLLPHRENILEHAVISMPKKTIIELYQNDIISESELENARIDEPYNPRLIVRTLKGKMV